MILRGGKGLLNYFGRSKRFSNRALINLEKNPRKNERQDEHEIVDKLINEIVYNKDGFIVFNKPRGMPMTRHTDIDKYSFDDLSPLICKHLGLKDLILLKSLSKNYSGLTLLSESEDAAHKINKSLNHNRCSKISGKYWIIAVECPQQTNLSDKIFVKQFLIDNIKKYSSLPPRQVSNKQIKHGDVKCYNFTTKVLCTNSEISASLIEISTNTKSNHLIEMIAAQKLLCPVLGDHLYSHQVRRLKSFNSRTLEMNLEKLEYKPQVISKMLAYRLRPLFSRYFNPETSPSILDLPLMIHFHSLSLKNTWSPPPIRNEADYNSQGSNTYYDGIEEMSNNEGYGDVVELKCNPDSLFQKTAKILNLTLPIT